MKYGYIDAETGNEIPSLIKSISYDGEVLVIKFLDGSYNIQDKNEKNIERALELMEKQAKDRNESGEKERVNKRFKLYRNLRPVFATSTISTALVPFITGAIQESQLFLVAPIVFATMGLVTEVEYKKEKKHKLELDKYACYFEIKEAYEKLYNSNETSHMIDNLHAGTKVKGFLSIKNIDNYSTNDIIQISRNIENINSLSGLFVDTNPKVNCIKK